MQQPSTTLRLCDRHGLKSPSSSSAPTPSPERLAGSSLILELSTEEPGFSRNRGFLDPGPSTPRVALCPQRPNRSWIAVWIAARFGRLPSPGSPRLSARQRALSFVTVGLMVALGCVAIDRSVSAFQTAWRVTDTTPAPTAPAAVSSRYDFQNSQIPGPFEKDTSLWSALRKHIGLAPQASPSPKPGK